MSEIKALEKLRKIDGNSSIGRYCREIANEIEREVAERYMELPVDADGVPIHVGDMLECEDRRGETYRLHARGVFVYEDGRVGVMNERLGIWYPLSCRHVKLPRLEDVLRECAEAYANGADVEMGSTEELFMRYADKVRKRLLGGEDA